MLDLEQAVARFFSSGTAHDRKEAKRLIAWLDRCGYVIVRKVDQAGAPREEAPATKQPAR